MRELILCFNVECVLLRHNFDSLGGYLVVTARHLVVTARYGSLLGVYWWLLLVPMFSMNAKIVVTSQQSEAVVFRGVL